MLLLLSFSYDVKAAHFFKSHDSNELGSRTETSIVRMSDNSTEADAISNSTKKKKVSKKKKSKNRRKLSKKGSVFGNYLRKIPYFGGLVGAIGDVGSGTVQTLAGIVTLNKSKTFTRGITLIKQGGVKTVSITLKDTYAGAIGLSFGTIGSTFSWLKDAGNQLLQGKPIGSGKMLGIMFIDLIIPEYGWWNGWRWGNSQFGVHGPKPINQGGRAGYIHDNNLVDIDWVLRFKGKDIKDSTPNGIIGGTIGLLGSIPFAILKRNHKTSQLK